MDQRLYDAFHNFWSKCYIELIREYAIICNSNMIPGKPYETTRYLLNYFSIVIDIIVVILYIVHVNQFSVYNK